MKSVEIKDLTQDFEAAHGLVESVLRKNRVSDVIIDETMLIFEALCHNIFEQNEGKDITVTVTGRGRFGSAGIILSYEGDMYISERDDPGEPTPEERILSAYGDRIDYIYRSRFNSIHIQARRSYASATISYLIAVVLALLTYVVIHHTAGADAETALRSNIVFPLERLFANAMLMVGAPVTFLSLLKNLTGIYILSERDSGVRKITRQTLVSSAFSTFLALVACQIVAAAAGAMHISLFDYTELSVQMDIGTFISELIPSDIISPFQSLSPFPLILLAGLVTYAFCSVGKYFDRMKNAINVCFALFSRMLGIVMYTLPFFAFCMILDILLQGGFSALGSFGGLIVIVVLSLILPLIYYSIRLAIRGVSVKGFFSRLMPLLGENFKIASVIDAVPFNIRYCIKNYGLERKHLESAMPILAQINLDGSCFILTFVSVMFVMFSNSSTNIGTMLLIAMLVFVLSLGAPNQPGGCIIGTLIILHYAGAPSLITLAIFEEVFFGTLLNLMNVTGDVITVVADERPDLSK